MITINTKKYKRNLDSNVHFSYWLAGLIDGGGCRNGSVTQPVSKVNSTSCEIVVSEKQYNLLTIIKKRLGGKISKRTNSQAYRWRLHSKKQIKTLIHTINGKLLLDPKIQLQKVCTVLNIEYKHETLFSIDNYWITGFYEAQGYFHINTRTLQCNITISQKTSELLEKIQLFFGGQIDYDINCKGYLYTASSTSSLERWFNYFAKFPLKSHKNINLVKFRRICLFKQRKYHLSSNEKHRKKFYRLLEL